jgi:outer membrane murein-binding lipoprotein Lpp
MDDSGAHDDIETLEARIEALSESIERCRKMGLIAKLTIAGGFVWLGLLLLGVTAFAPTGFVIAIAAVIGGTVLFGANSSTQKQHEAMRHEAESLRTELIEHLELRPVGDHRRPR